MHTCMKILKIWSRTHIDAHTWLLIFVSLSKYLYFLISRNLEQESAQKLFPPEVIRWRKNESSILYTWQFNILRRDIFRRCASAVNTSREIYIYTIYFERRDDIDRVRGLVNGWQKGNTLLAKCRETSRDGCTPSRAPSRLSIASRKRRWPLLENRRLRGAQMRLSRRSSKQCRMNREEYLTARARNRISLRNSRCLSRDVKKYY